MQAILLFFVALVATMAVADDNTTTAPPTPPPTTANITDAPPPTGSPQFPAMLFVDPTVLPQNFWGFLQVCFLGGVYAAILMNGVNLIQDGSELLLLIPSWAPMIGSIVLPVLGAVPDGAVVLFSGMGPDAQTQLSVGIGALAGSTIMLLTVPWFLAQMAGRVNLDAAGNGTYVKPAGAGKGWKKLDPPDRLSGTGVNVSPAVQYAAKFMLLTLVSYFVVQIPAMGDHCTQANEDKLCKTPRTAALIAGILTVVLFVVYLVDQSRLAKQNIVTEGRTEETQKRVVASGLMSLRGVFAERFRSGLAGQGGGVSYTELEGSTSTDPKLRAFLRPFFNKYDADRSGAIDAVELANLLRDLGENPTPDRTKALMAEMDSDKSGSVDFDEFCKAIAQILASGGSFQGAGAAAAAAVEGQSREAMEEEGGAGGDDEEEEEEDEVPEDIAELPVEQQRAAILKRSFGMMAVGTLIVVLVSDPMVGILSSLGTRTGIPPFYVSFVLAPLVSNGSELIAAYSYALKKTSKTMAISLSTLVGAAIMNNTFCLAIFLFLVYFKRLRWIFTAEVTSIVFVELIMFGIILGSGKTLRTWTAFAVLSLFPLSIVLVAGLEAGGLN